MISRQCSIKIWPGENLTAENVFGVIAQLQKQKGLRFELRSHRYDEQNLTNRDGKVRELTEVSSRHPKVSLDQIGTGHDFLEPPETAGLANVTFSACLGAALENR
jgi:hypothetical protein